MDVISGVNYAKVINKSISLDDIFSSCLREKMFTRNVLCIMYRKVSAIHLNAVMYAAFSTNIFEQSNLYYYVI